MLFSGLILAISVLARAVASSPGDTADTELSITVHFPEENPFHHVVNGEKNSVYLLVENRSEKNATIKSVAGSFHEPESQALVKNISTLAYGVTSLAGTKFSIPFHFHSELKPGDYSLHIWVDHAVEGTTYRVDAYEGVVSVVEPEISIFDFKMLSIYVIATAALGAVIYFGVLSLFPSLAKPKKTHAKPAKEDISTPVSAVKASGTGYQEEWIPEHHLRTTSKKGQKKIYG